MIQVFEFSTLEGHRYPCNILAKNIKEAKNIIKKNNPDLKIMYLAFRLIDEWECVIGLS